MQTRPRKLLGMLALGGLLWAVGFSGAETIYGLRSANSLAEFGTSLVFFDSATPGTINTVGDFTGVLNGHRVRSLDFRPATGQLYAISTESQTGIPAQLYTVNLATAALTPVGAGFSLGNNNNLFVSMDFNPVTDTVRIVTGASASSGQSNNFRANPNTGALVAQDTNLAFSAGDPQTGFNSYNINGIAHSNNVAGAAATTLFGWEFQRDSLITIGGAGGLPSPDGGLMFTVNTPPSFLLSFPAMGMDFSGLSGTLYVTHDDAATGTVMGLYTRDPQTGAETFIGNYGGGLAITDISVQPVPEPATLSLLGAALIGGFAWQRRRNERLKRSRGIRKRHGQAVMIR